MSRGLGKVERAILAHLALYRRVGPDMGLTWSTEGSFNRTLVWPNEYESDRWNVERFERGEIVEVRRLRRELGVPKGTFSRALRGLRNKGFVRSYDAAIGEALCNTKFVSVTSDGLDKCELWQRDKVGA